MELSHVGGSILLLGARLLDYSLGGLCTGLGVSGINLGGDGAGVP